MLEINELKIFIFSLPLLLIAIVIKSSSDPLAKVISSEIMYSGNHFSGNANNFTSDTLLESLTYKGFALEGLPIRNFLESFSLVKAKPSCLIIFDKNFGRRYILGRLPFRIKSYFF